MNIEGAEVKHYSSGGRYIMDTEISGSVLEMRLGRKKGGAFQTGDEKDYIRYKDEEREDAVTLISKISGTFGEQLYLKFPEYIYIQVEPDLVLTKILASEDDPSIALSRSGNAAVQYFVYADGQTLDTCATLSEAVSRAEEERGNVIDSQENILWECVFDDYAIVAGMDDGTLNPAGNATRAQIATILMRFCEGVAQ